MVWTVVHDEALETWVRRVRAIHSRARLLRHVASEDLMDTTRLALLPLGLLFVACSAPVVEKTGETSAEITNGAVGAGHPSVGKVYFNSGSCSGTLIGPTSVLTAAHCVGAAMSFTVGSGYHSVRAAHVHPGYSGGPPDNDIAVLILDAPITSVAPTPLSGSTVGLTAPVTLLGFGVTCGSFVCA